MNADRSERAVTGLVSIVAPAYDEESGLDRFANRVDAIMRSSGLPYEIVFVNDGSTDQTLSVMQSLRSVNPNITIVNLSRNFGKETAMTAGSPMPSAMPSSSSTRTIRIRPSSFPR